MTTHETDSPQLAAILAFPVRQAALRPMPNRCSGFTTRMRYDGIDIILRTAEYEDGKLAEIAVDCPKLSLTQRGTLQAFARAISIGLQHGVPLERYVEAYLYSRSSSTSVQVEHNPRIVQATSLEDMILRELAITYLGRSDLIQTDTDE
ncbi:MAG: hypothetical protein DI628_01485 [Blastochloris viridis]|uniref:ribonucleoside-diphosphate reductase n=1 Tax=Blastochloris viridis TaxID=1079 RepID=A0A6N4RDF5_BLAVI|nr:MAG: hypothetical protein DI628_01485 [Blastochloris viridis]